MSEDKISKSLYEINKRYLECKYALDQKAKKRISFKNIKVLTSYLRSLSFARIVRFFKSKKNIEIGDDPTLEIEQHDRNKNKIVVYTSIFGKYDILLEPFYVNKDIDYVIITDQEVPIDSVWKKRHFEFPKEFKHMSSLEKNRYCKMLPHRFFPNYDFSIYIDGNVRIVTDLEPIIASMNGFSLGIHTYPVDCIYNMKSAIIAGKRAGRKEVSEQVKRYKKEGFPKHFGAFECNILVRKHNDKQCCEIMEKWWKEFSSSSSKRDQLSLPYVLWKNGMTANFVFSLGQNVRLNPRFQVFEHVKKNK